jgi:hypothetical protein
MTGSALSDENDGPARKALTQRQRQFVDALLDNGGNQTRAAISSGTDPKWARDYGSKLARNPKVIAALKEEADRRVRVSAPLAMDVLVEIMNNPTHKDRLKAAESVLNRSGLIVASVVEHNVTHKGQTAPELLLKIKQMASQLGLDPQKLLGRNVEAAKIIDAEFTVVEPDPFTWSPG